PGATGHGPAPPGRGRTADRRARPLWRVLPNRDYAAVLLAAGHHPARAGTRCGADRGDRGDHAEARLGTRFIFSTDEGWIGVPTGGRGPRTRRCLRGVPTDFG